MTKIPITIQFHHSLHIGSTTHNREDIDIPIIKKPSPKYGKKTPYIPANAIKGHMRNLAFNILHHLFQDQETQKIQQKSSHMDDMNDVATHPFVSLFGAPNIPGKLRFTDANVKNLNKEHVRIKTGINIDRTLQITKPQALFNYEIADIGKMEFEIETIFLNEKEKALLFGLLNAMKNSTLGGKGTIGAGCIIDVDIKNQDFKKQAKQCLEKVLKQKESK